MYLVCAGMHRNVVPTWGMLWCLPECVTLWRFLPLRRLQFMVYVLAFQAQSPCYIILIKIGPILDWTHVKLSSRMTAEACMPNGIIQKYFPPEQEHCLAMFYVFSFCNQITWEAQS